MPGPPPSPSRPHPSEQGTAWLRLSNPLHHKLSCSIHETCPHPTIHLPTCRHLPYVPAAKLPMRPPATCSGDSRGPVRPALRLVPDNSHGPSRTASGWRRSSLPSCPTTADRCSLGAVPLLGAPVPLLSPAGLALRWVLLKDLPLQFTPAAGPAASGSGCPAPSPWPDSPFHRAHLRVLDLQVRKPASGGFSPSPRTVWGTQYVLSQQCQWGLSFTSENQSHDSTQTLILTVTC